MSFSCNFDYHMHTSFSDGQNTMEEMFNKVKSIGLKRFGITDHFELNAKNTVKASAREYNNKFNEIKKISKDSGIKFYRGIETGIGKNGLLIPQEEIERDYTIASVHKVSNDENCDENEYWKKYKRLIENALEKYDFEILGHIEGYLPVKNDKYLKTTFEQRRKIERKIAIKYFSFDWYEKIAEIMKKRKIYLEIHGATNSPRIEVIDLMRKRGVKFSFGSDAHSSEQLVIHRQYIENVINLLDLNDNDFINFDKS